MKKLYFFIFMIVFALSQNNVVNAHTYKLPAGKVVGAPVAQTITFPAFTTAQTAGFADITLTATASSGLGITYTSSNTAVVTIVSGKIHYIGIGSAVITATQPGDNVNWLPATSVSLPITVNPTITFANLGSVAFTGTDITLAATSNAAVATWPITYTTSDPTVATIVGGKLHCVGLGTCTITATQQGSVYPGVAYTASTKTATVTITAGAAPTITWTGSAGTALQTADLALGATSTFTNPTQFPIIYTITPANPGVATIVNNRLHMNGTGTVTIIATQPGNSKFTDATPVSANFVITAPAAPTFSTALGGKVFGTTLDFDPAATQGGWVSTITYTSNNTALATIVNNKIHLVSGPITAGQVTIGASYTYPVGTGGTASTAVTNNATLAATVAGAVTSPVLTFASPGSKAFTTTDFPLGASSTSTSSTPITFTSSNTAVATIVNNNIHYVGLGTSTITASQGGAAYIAGAIPAPVAQTLTVTAPTITATAPGAKLTNSADFAPAATATIANVPITFTVSPATIAIMVNGNVHLTGGTGTATITASQDMTGTGYPQPVAATTTFAVTAPANPTITFTALGSKPYAPGTTQLAATSTVASPAITYTSSNPAVATVSSTGVLTLIGALAPPNNFTIITASQGGGSGGALGLPADVQNTLTVTPAVITFPTLGTKVYITTDLAPGATSTNTAAAITYTSSNPAVATIVAGNIHFVGAGTTTITASQGGGVNGTATLAPDVSQVLTVTAPVITFPPLGTKQFTSTDINPGATAPYLSINSIAATTLTAGTGYTTGTYFNVPLTGGTGTGATANINVVSGIVTSAVIVNAGIGYTVGNTLTAANTLVGGTGTGLVVTVSAVSADLPITYTSSNAAVATIVNGLIHFTGAPAVNNTTVITASQGAGLNGYITGVSGTVAGSGYTNSTYTLVPLTGGIGTGAVATVVVTAGSISSVVITNGGSGYKAGDVLSAAATSIGGTGTGFSTTVASTVVSNTIPLPAPVSQTLTVTSPTITFSALGTKTYSTTDITPGATSSVSNVAINYASSNTAVATIKNAGIASFNKFINGSQYTSGTYTGVALTGGTGTGATATVVVGPVASFFTTISGSTTVTFIYGVQSVNISNAGSGYTVGDVLTIPAASIGGTGSGFSITVSGVSSFIHYVGTGTTNITASQGGGATGTTTLPADVTQALTVTSPILTFPALGTQKLPVADINPGATSTLTSTPVTYTSDNANVATILSNSILQLSSNSGFFGGSGYQNGVFTNVPLTGGTGSGATANITVNGGVVTSAVIVSGGTGYTFGDNLTTPALNLGGSGLGFTTSPSVVGGAIHINGAGTANIKASQGGGASGSALLPADVTVPITILPYTITFPALGTKTLTNVDYTPTAVSTNTNVAITYTSSTPAVATIVNGNIHYVAAGTTTITASQGGGATGTATLPADATSVLTVASPVITFAGQFGTKTTLSGDFDPGATSTIQTPAIAYTSSNTAVATILSGSAISGTITPGVNYLSGTYNNVSLTGGTGTGAKASLVIVGGGVSTVTLTTGGTGYVTGDVLSATPATLGGVGTGFKFTLTNAGPVIHPVGAGTTVIEATQQGSAAGTIKPVTATLPADVTASLTISAPAITFPALGTKPYTNVDFMPGATSPVTTVPITYTSSNTAVATIVNTLTLNSSINIGAGYVNGTYPSVALTGGSGSGAVATIVVANNVVSAVTVTANGAGYLAGDVLSASTSSLGGGAGSGFSVSVYGYISYVHILPGFPASPNNTTTIKASQGGGATGTTALPADVSQVLTVTAPVITFPALGSVVYSNTDINPGATSSVNLPITYTSSNTAVATIVAGQIHMLKAGTAIITASQGGGTTGLTGIPADVTSTLTVTGGPAITFAALGSKAFTTTDLAPGATSTVTTTPISYTSSNTAVATIVNGAIHFIGTGTSTITASQGGGATGTATLPPDFPQTLTVTSPVITFAALGTKTISSVDLAPGATSTVANVAIAYTSSDPTIATIVNGNIHFVGGIGTTNIRATQQGTAVTATSATATATLPADVQVTLTVAAPVITFTATQMPATLPFNTLDRIPGATSTLANIPITYTSSDPNVATIVNGNIHFVGLGTTTITASQQTAAIAAGFTAPVDVSLPLTVTAPTLTMTALGSKVFTTTDLPLLNLVTGTVNQSAPITFTSSDPTVATIVNNQLRYVGIGNCIITATQAAYPGAGAPPVATSALIVTPAVLTVAPAIGTSSISAADVQLAYTSTISTSTFPVTYTSSDPSVATVVGGLLHLVSPGTCTITGTQITNTNYQPLPTVSTLTVTSLIAPVNGPTLTFPALGTRQYSNNGDITPAATSTLGTVNITYTSSNPAVATIVNGLIHLTPPSLINGVVTYPIPNTTVITASQGGGSGGTATVPADVSTVLTVTPAGISFPPLGVQKFNTTDLAPGATSSYVILNANNIAQPIVYTSSDPTVATIVNGNIHFVGLGTTTITASLGNVIVPDVSQVMTVVAPGITFAATASRVYSTADVPPGATSTLATAITYTSTNPAVATIVNGNIHFTGIGQTTIIASQAASGNSTAPLNVAQLLTVTPPTLTFAATRTIAFTLTDQDPLATSTLLTTPITYTSSNPALVSIVNNKLHFNIPTSNLTNNTAIITATQVGESNIPVQTALQTLTVTQAVIFPNVLIKAYGDPDFSPAFSTFGSGYPVSYSSATTATATTVTANGIPNSMIHIVAPGTSVITASQAGDGNTTAATNATATLTVTQAPLTITPKNVTIAYGTTAVPVLPVNYFGFKSASGGAPLDDSTKFSAQPTVYLSGKALNGNFSTLPVGTYTLTAAGAVSTLYSFTYGTGTLTVAAATQTLTWPGNNQLPVSQQTPINKSFGDDDFDPLARSTGDPVVYTSSDPTVATIVNGNVHIVGAGTATITATLNPTSGNYSGSAVLTKTLIVAKGKQTIAVATIPFLLRNSAAYTPTAAASSGLPVSVSVTDASYIKVVNGTLAPLHVGTTKVSFTQAGNANYAAADTVNVFVKVVDPAGADLIVHQALSPDGDGVNDFLYIEGVNSFPVNHVKIIDRNGGNVFETDNYDNKNNVFTGKAKNGNKLPGGTYFFIVDYNVGNERNHVTGYFVLKY
jgi:gliding motility-associated-like protein